MPSLQADPFTTPLDPPSPAARAARLALSSWRALAHAERVSARTKRRSVFTRRRERGVLSGLPGAGLPGGRKPPGTQRTRFGPWRAQSGRSAGRAHSRVPRLNLRIARVRCRGLGFRVRGSRFRVHGERFRVRGSRFRVQRKPGTRELLRGTRECKPRARDCARTGCEWERLPRIRKPCACVWERENPV